MDNEGRSAQLAVTNLVSNKGKWNNIVLNSQPLILLNFVYFKKQAENDFMLSDICRIPFHIRSNAGIINNYWIRLSMIS